MIIYEREIKTDKSFVNQLTSLHGISDSRSTNICALLGLKKHGNINKMLKTVKNDLPVVIKELVDKDKKYIIENSLRHQKTLIRKDLRALGNYKSIRFSQNLPVHGQRTHTNAKTQKKKRK